MIDIFVILLGSVYWEMGDNFCFDKIFVCLIYIICKRFNFLLLKMRVVKGLGGCFIKRCKFGVILCLV